MKFDTHVFEVKNYLKSVVSETGRKMTREEITPEMFTGINPTDIFGIKNPNDTITVSRETWKRIELFAEILSAVDMSINQDKLNEILGGRS
jgi:hypothetical protein